MAGALPQIPGVPELEARSEALPTPYNEQRVTPEDLGSGKEIGNALENFGSTAGQLGAGVLEKQQAIAAKAKSDADATAFAQADADQQNVSNKLTTDFKQLQGANAHDAYQDTLQGFDDSANKIAAKLQPGPQRDSFVARAALHRDTLDTNLHAHLAQQNGVMRDQAFAANDAAATTGIANAAASLTVDGQAGVDALINRQLHIVQVRAHVYSGLDDRTADEQVSVEKKRLIGIAFTQMIGQAKSDDPVAARKALSIAQAYLDAHKAAPTGRTNEDGTLEMRGDIGADQAKDMAALAKAMKNGADSSVRAAQVVTDAIDPKTGATDPNKILTAISGSSDLAFIEGVQRRAAIHDSLVEKANAKDAKDLMTAGMLKDGPPDANGNPTKIIGPFSLSKVASDGTTAPILQRLTERDPKLAIGLQDLDLRETKIEAAEHNLASHDEAQKLKDASYDALGKVMVDIGSHRDEYKNASGDAYRQRLIKGEFGPMIGKDIDKAIGLFEADQKGAAGGRVSQTDVVDALRAAGIRNKDKQGNYIQPLTEATESWIASERAKTGGKTPDDMAVRKFLDGELAKGNVKGGGSLFGDSFETTRYDYEQESKPGGKWVGKEFVPSKPQTQDAPTPLLNLTPQDHPGKTRVVDQNGKFGWISNDKAEAAIASKRYSRAPPPGASAASAPEPVQSVQPEPSGPSVLDRAKAAYRSSVLAKPVKW